MGVGGPFLLLEKFQIPKIIIHLLIPYRYVRFEIKHFQTIFDFFLVWLFHFIALIRLKIIDIYSPNW